jgi:K+ transporter
LSKSVGFCQLSADIVAILSQIRQSRRAYGIAVSLTMLMTSVLLFIAKRH